MFHISLPLIVSGFIASTIGTWILLGIWIPRIRLYHKGSLTRLGKISAVSAGLLPSAWGLLLIWMGIHPENKIPVLMFVLTLIIAVIGSVVGQINDTK